MTLCPLTPDDFCFDSLRTEDMCYYVPGGYHPVTIGDILGPFPLDESRRYRIMQKLGHGAFSTVWLAQKTGESGKWVAVKINIATSGLTDEAAMLEAACKARTTSGHFPTLHDYFSLHGPNGTHSVLVMDVVVPLDSDTDFPEVRRLSSMKVIARDLFEALSQLHSANIVHGDLHIRNIGFAFPQLATQETHKIMTSLGAYDLTLVLPYSSVHQTPSLPPYIAASCDIVKCYQKLAPTAPSQVIMYDFGNAHYSGTRGKRFACAYTVCPPELVFALAVEKITNPPVEPPTDIWALGATLYQICTGSMLFRDQISPRLAYKMTILGGSRPSAWNDWDPSLSLAEHPFSPSDTEDWWAARWKEVRKRCDRDVDADSFLSFLKRVIVLDPASRPTAEEILKDPWLCKQISLVLYLQAHNTT